MSDFELQRKNMVESQVRPSDITDRRIMRAMLSLPREAFAADDTRAVAYMDRDLPVGIPGGHGRRRALLAPRTLARMVQLLEVEPVDRVLVIGAASGYDAAIVAALAKSVVALEADQALAAQARTVLAAQGIANVAVVSGPHRNGWSAEAPYGAILVAGGVPQIPSGLLDQLQDGACLVTVLSEGTLGRIAQWRRLGGAFASRIVGEANAVQLPGFEREPGFVF